MTFDAASFKSQFPLFNQSHNDQLVYLDNAATTQKPHCVIKAISEFYTNGNANAQRSSHRLAQSATAMVEHTRTLAAEFLGTTKPSEVVFTTGATSALNMLAYGLSPHCNSGDEILLTHSEHHANLLPWQRLAHQQQCQLTFLPEKNGVPCWAKWPTAINERTRIVSFSGASNVLGYVAELSIIAAIKQQFPHIIIVVDASQLACHRRLQVEQWQCDFLVCSAHKFYGPTGVGLLYGKSQWLDTLPPFMVGGEMVEHANLHTSEFTTGPTRFEAGTAPLGAIAGLNACLIFWQQQNRPAMLDYEQQLTDYLHQQLSLLCNDTPALRLLSSAENNIGIATLTHNSSEFSLSDLGHWLDEYDIAVRIGHHCAQPLWQHLKHYYGSNKGLRISLNAYNTTSDIDALISAITQFFNALHQNNINAVSDKNIWADQRLTDIHWQDLLERRSWQQRYKTLLHWGQYIEPKPNIRIDTNLVRGCESAVWLDVYKKNQRYYLLIDSDSNIIKGLCALLLLWLNGKTSEQISAINIPERYTQLGFEKHLSPSRMNGFNALLKRAQSIVVLAN